MRSKRVSKIVLEGLLLITTMLLCMCAPGLAAIPAIGWLIDGAVLAVGVLNFFWGFKPIVTIFFAGKSVYNPWYALEGLYR
jgi:hypothetical protein